MIETLKALAEPIPDCGAVAGRAASGGRNGGEAGLGAAAGFETPAGLERCRAGGRASRCPAADLRFAGRAAERNGSVARAVPADLGGQFPEAGFRAGRNEEQEEIN